jgi:hypothetical protein
MSKQIGSYNEDGTIKEWPEHNLDGQPYERHASRVNIGGGKFVILPVNFNDWDRLAKLREQHKPVEQPVVEEAPTEQSPAEAQPVDLSAFEVSPPTVEDAPAADAPPSFSQRRNRSSGVVNGNI